VARYFIITKIRQKENRMRRILSPSLILPLQRGTPSCILPLLWRGRIFSSYLLPLRFAEGED